MQRTFGFRLPVHNLTFFYHSFSPPFSLSRSQVSKVVKTLANGLKFRTACFTSLCDLDAERKKLRLGTDVLVSTPGWLLQLIKDEEVNLSELNVMVLDEADVLLLDESFPLQPIGQACKHSSGAVSGASGAVSGTNGVSSGSNGAGKGVQSTQTSTNTINTGATNNNSKGGKNKRASTQLTTTTTTTTTLTTPTTTRPLTETQFLFVTATLPDVVVSQIESEFPEVMTLKGPGLHRIASSVEVSDILCFVAWCFVLFCVVLCCTLFYFLCYVLA